MGSTFANSFHDHTYQQSEYHLPEDPDTLSPPSAHHLIETPGASTSNLSNYQPSDISDIDDDPFFGASSADPGVPSFLEDEHLGWEPSTFPANNDSSATSDAFRHVSDSSYPLTPEHTASIQTSSPRSDRRATVTRHIQNTLPPSISPQELQKPFVSNPILSESSQLTPSQSSSGRSSEDGLAPGQFDMRAASPRVTVSVWDHDQNTPAHAVERTLEDSPSTLYGGFQSAGDLISASHNDDHSAIPSRDVAGRWQRDPFTGQAGLDPHNRPQDEVDFSANELSSQKKINDRNQDVDKWLSNSEGEQPDQEDHNNVQAIEQSRDQRNDGIPLGDNTENRFVPGRTYYHGEGGKMNEQDFEIIASNRNWSDAPTLPHIRRETPGRHQPQSSQAAIERFERLCRDTDANSLLSRSATWGTRRRSIHSVADLDEEGVLSGNFLRKLTISRGADLSTDLGNRAGSLLNNLRGFVRRPSVGSMRKRRSSAAGEEPGERDHEDRPPLEKRDSEGSAHLGLPERTQSWTKKSKPIIETTLASMTQSLAHIGATSPTHSRKNSYSGGVPASGRNSFSSTLKVNNTLKRPRSRSELPQPTSGRIESHPNLISLWKGAGGPPVAALSTPNLAAVHAANPPPPPPPPQAANVANVENEDDEDDDDDLYEDSDMKGDANLIDKVEANFAGFQSHILMMNPYLDGNPNSSFLVDRLAQHQLIRFKTLLGLKVKHLTVGAGCPCGSLCTALGGQVNYLEPKEKDKSAAKWADVPPHQLVDEDGSGTPTDGVVTQDSFPQDIPIPPAQHLPAEFECQLCYGRKKFYKPSDWTKHVHEDVQPFTCTWDRCRDAKSFKRKADWVRHENEGHRHLEWWTCDVEECRHTCYRRDNFLQHLVREHKFSEPKVKTKAAIKKAGNSDPTWSKVEECHQLTRNRPQDEPCRFCGKSFPTWKKLTVHLAKHMEQISLPVLRLVAAKAQEISADTIISPVQDLPPPPPVIPDNNAGLQATNAYMTGHDSNYYLNMQPNQMAFQNQGGFLYPMIPQGQQQVYPNQCSGVPSQMQQPPSALGVETMNQGYTPVRQMPDGHMASPPFGHHPGQSVAEPNHNTTEPFPQLDALGLHNPTGAPLVNQVGYGSMMDPSGTSASPFSGHGSASPYSHSPHLNATKHEHEHDWSQSPNVWG